MSIVTMKRKTAASVPRGGRPISGRHPGGLWVLKQPSCCSGADEEEEVAAGIEGFSLNGGQRNITNAQERKMSSIRTPYKGVHAIGHGGSGGKYSHGPDSTVMAITPANVSVNGNQHEIIKPSTLSTFGLLKHKYPQIYSGATYPRLWVKPMYTGWQTNTSSQGVYLYKLARSRAGCDGLTTAAVDVANMTSGSINVLLSRADENGNGNGNGASSTMKREFGTATECPVGFYAKKLHKPDDYSTYLQQRNRACLFPTTPVFPPAVQSGTGILRGGITVAHVGSSSRACAV